MLEVQFCGAARAVTGSMHVVRVGGRTLCLDCGLFQGRRIDTDAANRRWTVHPGQIDALVLSHAHIDHIGRLPRFVRHGFKGIIYATSPTRDLAAIMLADSAHIQQEDADYMNSKPQRAGGRQIEPLYGIEDVGPCLKRFRTIDYDEPFCPIPGVVACYRDAGHMLGSASIVLEMSPDAASGGAFDPFCPLMQPMDRLPDGGVHRLVFSGDLGRPDSPILRDAKPLPPCHTLICESTYGGRLHTSQGDPIVELKHTVRRTLDRGGKVIIPAFAVGRAQVLIYELHRLMAAREIPEVPVFLDSPLGVDASEIFKMHPQCYDTQATKFDKATGDLLGCRTCVYIRRREDSMALNHDQRPMIIISPSGMCENGRVLHHLKNNIGYEKNTVVIVGYCAPHTLGRRLADGLRDVRIYGMEYAVRCEVKRIDGFSGHMDQRELSAWLAPTVGQCQRVCLVHGEEEQQLKFADHLKQQQIYSGDVLIPRQDEIVKLG